MFQEFFTPFRGFLGDFGSVLRVLVMYQRVWGVFRSVLEVSKNIESVPRDQKRVRGVFEGFTVL